jgi:hypothetical protein
MREDLDERILQHVFRFILVTGIPTANSHHFAGVTLEEPVLASGVPLQAVFNQLLFGQVDPLKTGFCTMRFESGEKCCLAGQK